MSKPITINAVQKELSAADFRDAVVVGDAPKLDEGLVVGASLGVPQAIREGAEARGLQEKGRRDRPESGSATRWRLLLPVRGIGDGGGGTRKSFKRESRASGLRLWAATHRQEQRSDC